MNAAQLPANHAALHDEDLADRAPALTIVSPCGKVSDLSFSATSTMKLSGAPLKKGTLLIHGRGPHHRQVERRSGDINSSMIRQSSKLVLL